MPVQAELLHGDTVIVPLKNRHPQLFPRLFRVAQLEMDIEHTTAL